MPEAALFRHSKSIPRWVAWRNEMRNGKPTKVPYSPHTGHEAKADDSRKWNTRTAAEARVRNIVNGTGGGIGIQLGDLGDGTALGGIDLDTCRREDGTFEPWAQEVNRFASYTEISPERHRGEDFLPIQLRGHGLLRPALGAAKYGRQFKRGNGKDHPPAIELYLSHRYFAATEQRVDGTPDNIATIDAATLLWLLTEAGPGIRRKKG